MNINIFQELLITVWFLIKMSVFGLTIMGAQVAWDKYGSLIDPIRDKFMGVDDAPDHIDHDEYS